MKTEEFVYEDWGSYTFRFKKNFDGVYVAIWLFDTSLPIHTNLPVIPWPEYVNLAVSAWLQNPMGMTLRDYLTKMFGEPSC